MRGHRRGSAGRWPFTCIPSPEHGHRAAARTAAIHHSEQVRQYSVIAFGLRSREAGVRLSTNHGGAVGMIETGRGLHRPAGQRRTVALSGRSASNGSARSAAVGGSAISGSRDQMNDSMCRSGDCASLLPQNPKRWVRIESGVEQARPPPRAQHMISVRRRQLDREITEGTSLTRQEPPALLLLLKENGGGTAPVFDPAGGQTHLARATAATSAAEHDARP